jgi:hypothetical protein
MSMDARFVALTCALLAAAFASAPAQAVPSYARALGNAPCSTCHTAFPQLNAFGRQFKLSGYTFGGSPAASSNKEPAGSPDSSVSLDALPPLSVMVQAAYTNIGTTLPDSQNNNGQLPQQASLFVAGRIAPGLGSFIQLTYSQEDGEIAMDNAELRYSHQKTIKGKPVIFGAVLNNNPTVEDLWNSTPAWGFPWAAPDVTPGPIASTLVDGGLSQDVIGIGGFVSVSGKLYAASTLYRSAHIGSVSPGSDSGQTIDNVATYWRVAWQFVKGAHSLEVGGYGLHARIVPEGIAGPTDNYDDRAVDLQYEHAVGSRNLVVHGTYIDEKTDLAASSVAGLVGVPDSNLNTLRVDAGLHGPKVGYVVGYQRSHGSEDTLRFGPEIATGSAVGRPDTNALLAEAIYSPWQNVQLRVQYTAYGKFNGASRNYDGFGRSASDNNTLLLHAWFVW